MTPEYIRTMQYATTQRSRPRSRLGSWLLLAILVFMLTMVGILFARGQAFLVWDALRELVRTSIQKWS
jgi:nitrate reductase NapE component